MTREHVPVLADELHSQETFVHVQGSSFSYKKHAKKIKSNQAWPNGVCLAFEKLSIQIAAPNILPFSMNTTANMQRKLETQTTRKQFC